MFEIDTSRDHVHWPRRPQLGPYMRVSNFRTRTRDHIIVHESNFVRVADAAGAYRPTMFRAFFHWVQRNCFFPLLTALRIDIVERRPVSQDSVWLLAQIVPVLRFNDQADAAMYRLAWC